jgi:hypothetical protein
MNPTPTYIPTPTGTVRLRDMEKNSSELGNCEVCEKFCSDVFLGVEIGSEGDYQRSLFGHEQCVKQALT